MGHAIARRGLLVVLVVLAGGHGARAAWIGLKACAAQRLLLHAWHDRQPGRDSPRPWPWADTHPIARLSVPRLAVDQLVLDGASGRTLAFGPGHLCGTALPGARGNAVLSGHRDTHFAFLQQLREGDLVSIERPDGGRVRYAIDSARVVRREDTSVLAPSARAQLTLVTCYPFRALRPGAELRYVVVARAL